MSDPRGTPWRRPRYESLLLVLVAVAALSPVYGISQDASRLCLTRAVVHGRLHDDLCLSTSGDRASYKGHLYTDKAPGMSILEVPAALAVRLPLPQEWPADSLRLWVVRLLSSGLGFLACVFLVGRVGEGLAPGYGGLALVTFGLGTLVAPFAAANFDHVPAAALGFGAFLLAWAQRPLLAGLAAGAALTVEYQTASILLVVGAYVALGGRRPLMRYALGVLPGATLLGAYDWLAFGAPWRLSYRYVTGEFARDQTSGFFGIAVPHPHILLIVLAGSGGLLVISPVVAAAAWGLVLLGRRYRPEAIVCAGVTLFFVLINSGYFLPYGGTSPGPRFMIAALPFLALGLGPVFARHPRMTTLLAAVSIVAISALTLTWASPHAGDHTIWVDLARLPVELGSSRFVQLLVANALNWLDVPRIWAAAVVECCAAAALTLALLGSLATDRFD